MPCYHPLIRIEDLTKWEIAADGHKYHPAKIYSLKGNGSEEGYENLYENARAWQKPEKAQIIPCGKCIGCRLNYSREWANRGFLEAQQYKHNWFCTITYDEDHVPIPEWIKDSNGITWTNWEDGQSLAPEHLVTFIKNVRQIMRRKYKKDLETWKKTEPNKRSKKPKPPKIRYLACGEYGSETLRPHYHIIFFNLDLPLEDLYAPRIINKEIYYQSHIIERAWTPKGEDKPRGICNISEASWNTIAYTARYITKKINGPESEELYASAGKIKEFLRCSKMPGIGQGYYDKHKDEIYERDEIIIKNKGGVISCKPPKYFDELLKKEDPEKYEKIRKEREKRAKDNNQIKDMQNSYYREEQRAIEEREQEEASLKLIREMEKNRS